MSEDKNDRYLSNSLVRGLEILRMFNGDMPTLSLSEIANKLNVSRTTPYRILFTLQSLGYIRQDELTKRYELTPKVLELGFTYLNTMPLLDLARPYLEELRDETGLSTHLGILEGNEVAYIARVPGKGVSTINVTVGSRLPAHATALGKVLLAFQKEEKLTFMLNGNELKSYTGKTKTELLALEKELTEIKEKGYSTSDEEFENGIFSVAAPILNRHGHIIAAINVVAPVAVCKGDFITETVIPALLKQADQLSSYSGYHQHN
jgi:IclR family transcriptional regulator, pca regulon regulatory protein